MTGKIQKLPSFLIDQIKAGEVIERPSTLLKELMENSLDAGATHIDVVIENAGIDLIRVSDNGCGIAHSDIPMAFERHATSKIQDFSDLFKLHTFGFRGEALASIAAVSKVKLRTSQSQENYESLFEIEDHQVKLHEQLEKAKDHGTMISVSELFFNTPVRLNFLQSQSKEDKALLETFQSFALSNPQVSFSLKRDNDRGLNYFATDKYQRIYDVLSLSHDETLRLERSYQKFHVDLIVSKSAKKSARNKRQFIFANKRFIDYGRIKKLISYKLKTLWGNTFGDFYIHVQAPSAMIDVNVHPNKINVKVQNEDVLMALISSMLSELIVKMQPTQAKESDEEKSIESQKNDIHYNEHTQYHENQINTHETNFVNLQKLWTSKGLFIQTDNKSYAISFKNLLKEILNKLSSEKSIIKKNPLLIAEPIECQNKVSIESIKSYGWDIEYISEKQYVITSVPELFQKDYDFSIIHSYLSSQLNHFDHFIQNPIIDEAYQKSFVSFIKQCEFNPKELSRDTYQVFLEDLFHDEF